MKMSVMVILSTRMAFLVAAMLYLSVGVAAASDTITLTESQPATIYYTTNGASVFVPDVSEPNVSTAAATIIWTGGGTDNLASNPTNWTGSILPKNDDSIVFDNTSTKDCIWDASVIPASLNLNTGYTGTVMLSAELMITGIVTISDGAFIIRNILTISPTYTITATAGNGGTVTPSTATVNYGGNQTFSISPNSGYYISDITVDGVSQGAITIYTFTDVTACHTIAASFKIDSYGITATAGSSGDISPSGIVMATYGASQIFTITPNAGGSIVDVIVDGVSQGPITSYTFTNVTAAHTITATFTTTTHTITATAGSRGSITPSGTVTVNSGDSQAFTITPDNRYTIADITVDGVSYGAAPSFTIANVTASHTIAATFALNSGAVTVSIDSPTKGATINRPDIMVTGTVTNDGGYETGVTVNGVLANVYGNQFVANHVPLAAGTNTITATATDINGEQSSDAITVDAVVSGNYISLTATTFYSTAPLATTLQIDGSFSIANSSLTSTGPAQPTFLSSSPDTYQAQMALEGIYYLTASVTGPDGTTTYQDTIGVVAENATTIDTLLRDKWSAMLASLSNKDIPMALKYISPLTQPIYQQMYTAIVNQLPAMVATQTGFNFLSVNNNSAFYDLVTFENGTTYKYEAVFVRDTNGLWVIQDF